MERTIIETERYTIVETDSCSLEEIVEFVVKENYLHHQKSMPENISEEVEELIKEEQQLLPTSRFFVARDNKGRLIGCIRLHRWNHISDLPITKFGIRVQEVFPKEEYPNIWHVGRFAITMSDYKSEISIFKILVYCTVYPIINSCNSVMLAELDMRLFFILKKMGIELNQLGTPGLYMGSEVVPGYSTCFGFNKFVNSYATSIKSLLSK
ncbi:MAG: hypothetical protein NC453_17375 [Muribaculum sp.]|nr:hypothetical protein [Muribaculum sp.]